MRSWIADLQSEVVPDFLFDRMYRIYRNNFFILLIIMWGQI